MSDSIERVIDLFSRGGPVMWPLLLLSMLAIALAVERAFFWTVTHRRGRDRWLAEATDALRKGDTPRVRALAADDSSVYGSILRSLADDPSARPGSVGLVESERPRFERFSATLNTIVTASPLLGILGTVLGIISSFELMAPQAGGASVSDINEVADGIAEALITTAFGLVVALISLFTAMVCRSHAERCLGAIETLFEAAQQSTERTEVAVKPAVPPGAESKPEQPVGVR